jgi:acetyltransferase-like isoleucine patch superfamily enzyme
MASLRDRLPDTAPVRRLRERLWRFSYGRGPRLASAWRRHWVILRHPHADVRFGRGCYLGPGFSLHIPGRGTFVAGDDVEFRRNFRAEIYGGRVTVGSGSFLTYDVVVACSTSIDIGERVGIGQASFLVDGSHRYRDLDVPFRDQGYNYRPLRIGDDVAIHSKVTIIADIGERAVIGANTVVTKPIPAFSVAAGSPARVLDYFGPDAAAPGPGAAGAADSVASEGSSSAAAQAARNAGASS